MKKKSLSMLCILPLLSFNLWSLEEKQLSADKKSDTKIATLPAQLTPAVDECDDIINTSGTASNWVQITNDTNLSYQTTDTGDRVMDFSSVGYMGGGVAFPSVNVMRTIQPSGNDDTVAIQNAINEVSSLPLQNGFRGAILLAPGTFNLADSLTINASGLVLRGSGTGSAGTKINLLGSPHVFIQIGTPQNAKMIGAATRITDSYVPSGVTTIHVASTAGFAPGNTVILKRPVTQEWLDLIKMSYLCDGCQWIPPGGAFQYDRVITKVDATSNTITLDSAIADSLDSAYLQPNGATLYKYSMTGRIQQIGVEQIRVIAPAPDVVPVPFPTGPTFSVLQLSGVQNAWVQNVVAEGFIPGIVVNGSSKWVTLQDVIFDKTPLAVIGGAGQAQFSLTNSQFVLCNRCISSGDYNFAFATGSTTLGPNVILNSSASGVTHIQPHMRWSTGLLLDNVTAVNGGIEYMSRGSLGGGHGWTMGWGVLWNTISKTVILQQAPGTRTWAIGVTGTLTPPPFPYGGPSTEKDKTNQYPATTELWGSKATPSSLYLAQLCKRLGRSAVTNIGY